MSLACMVEVAFKDKTNWNLSTAVHCMMTFLTQWKRGISKWCWSMTPEHF